MTELWKYIPGYYRWYQASTHGRIRSCDRIVQGADGKSYKRKSHVLSPALNQSGYFIVVLCKEGHRKQFTVHSLVASTFLGRCPDGCEILHGANGSLDNSVSNLSYGTHSDNRLDCFRDGTEPSAIAVRRSDGVVFRSIREAARQSNSDPKSIRSVLSGEQKTAAGFQWEKV